MALFGGGQAVENGSFSEVRASSGVRTAAGSGGSRRPWVGLWADRLPPPGYRTLARSVRIPGRFQSRCSYGRARATDGSPQAVHAHHAVPLHRTAIALDPRHALDIVHKISGPHSRSVLRPVLAAPPLATAVCCPIRAVDSLLPTWIALLPHPPHAADVRWRRHTGCRPSISSAACDHCTGRGYCSVDSSP